MALSRDRDRRGGGSRYQYRPRTAEDVKEQAEQNAGNFDPLFKQGYDIYTPEEGENVVRYCPPTWSGARAYTYEVWVHYNVGPRGGSYLCLKKMHNKRCPVCDAADDADRHGEKDDAKELSAKKRKVAWIMDRDDNKATLPKIWNQGWTLDADVGSILTDRKTGQVLQIDDQDNGYDISFKRRGKDKNTKYSGFQVDRDPSPLCDDQRDQDDVMDFIQANPLPDTLKFYKAEYLEDLVSGAAGEDDNDDEYDDNNMEDDDMVARARSSRGGGGRGRDDDRGGRGGKDRGEDRTTRRSRGRDEPDDDRDTRRGRGRDEPDDDRRGRGGRGRDEPEDRDTRRGRGRDDGDRDGRGRDRDDDNRDTRRGRGRDEPDDDLPWDNEDKDYDADNDDEAGRDEADDDTAGRDDDDRRPARSARGNGKASRDEAKDRDTQSRPRRPPPRDQGRSKGGRGGARR